MEVADTPAKMNGRITPKENTRIMHASFLLDAC
jgi:hypothetical protein